MQIIKVNLPAKVKNPEIHIGADWHIGDSFSDIDLIKERINYIKNHENAFIILNGDLMNNATKTSVSDCYAEKMSPMEQLNTAISLLEPIKDKIIAITSGNHEDRTYNKEGIDLMCVVAKQLGIIDRYSKTSAYIFLSVGEAKRGHGEGRKNSPLTYTIFVTHGSGGGRKEGAKVIRLADMASIADADIYIHSHTHLPIIMKQSFFRVDRPNTTIKQVEKLFINTGATLNYGGYGEKYEFKPNSKENPVIHLSDTKIYAKATI